MSSVPIAHLTPDQYIELDRASDSKHEYWYGHLELETVIDHAAVINLPSLDCEIPVAEIYRKVEIFTRAPKA